MSIFLSNIFSGGVKDVLEGVGGVIDEFHTSPEEKNDMMVKFEQVITDRFSVLQESVKARYQKVAQLIQAEMASGDNFTKRARPSVVYFGLCMIFVNYLLVPLIQTHSGPETVEAFPLSTEFWIAWAGVVGIWTIGRSAEKYVLKCKATRAATGTDSVSEILEQLG